DSWPGKYNDLELALNVLNRGGFYVIDDMLPQPNWPEDHPPKVAALLNTIDALEGYHLTRLCWSTGIILVVKE
ncbi:MAG: SAM-dependent methyltransferase, partial [Verrucomicrobia bacterium]|nr:SAM-dependent methyltransferase [Verrucomicrobiota bacterium]